MPLSLSSTRIFPISFIPLILPVFLLSFSIPSQADSQYTVQSTSNCSQNDVCADGVLLPVWNPLNPSVGDKVARAIVYLVALVYMFLGMSIIADRFMTAIEVITSQEKCSMLMLINLKYSKEATVFLRLVICIKHTQTITIKGLSSQPNLFVNLSKHMNL